MHFGLGSIEFLSAKQNRRKESMLGTLDDIVSSNLAHLAQLKTNFAAGTHTLVNIAVFCNIAKQSCWFSSLQSRLSAIPLPARRSPQHRTQPTALSHTHTQAGCCPGTAPLGPAEVGARKARACCHRVLASCSFHAPPCRGWLVFPCGSSACAAHHTASHRAWQVKLSNLEAN